MPYMSASIQFLVSSPCPSSLFACNSPASSASSSYLSSLCSGSPPLSPGVVAREAGSSPASSWSRESFTSPPGPEPLESGQDACLRLTARFPQDCHLRLIHIPLPLYPHFVQAILSLILPESSARDEVYSTDSPASFSDDTSSEPSIATDFVNISVTPVECSIVCSKEAAARFFIPIANTLDPAVRGNVSISIEEFVAIQVDGEGLDAGQRVLDLTSPLALARM